VVDVARCGDNPRADVGLWSCHGAAQQIGSAIDELQPQWGVARDRGGAIWSAGLRLSDQRSVGRPRSACGPGDLPERSNGHRYYHRSPDAPASWLDQPFPAWSTRSPGSTVGVEGTPWDIKPPGRSHVGPDTRSRGEVSRAALRGTGRGECSTVRLSNPELVVPVSAGGFTAGEGNGRATAGPWVAHRARNLGLGASGELRATHD
jgi:hypothetical protein